MYKRINVVLNESDIVDMMSKFLKLKLKKENISKFNFKWKHDIIKKKPVVTLEYTYCEDIKDD